MCNNAFGGKKNRYNDGINTSYYLHRRRFITYFSENVSLLCELVKNRIARVTRKKQAKRKYHYATSKICDVSVSWSLFPVQHLYCWENIVELKKKRNKKFRRVTKMSKYLQQHLYKNQLNRWCFYCLQERYIKGENRKGGYKTVSDIEKVFKKRVHSFS